jgi:hypothetical protein
MKALQKWATRLIPSWLGLIAAVAVILPSSPITSATATARTLAARTLAAPAVSLAAPPTSSVKLQVQSARKSASPAANAPKALQNIGNYKWLINLDNTGKSEQGKDNPLCHPSTNKVGAPTPNGYPQGCYWPSIRYAVASPTLSEGTQTEWNRTTALPTFDGTRGLPDKCDGNGNPIKGNSAITPIPCKYLVSVTADGYQLGGAHFTVPNATGLVHVFLNPYPVPLGTVRLKVFNDNGPTDGTFDEQTESGLVNFLGLLNDFDGLVSQDYFGNPLCTQYQTNSSGKILLDASGRPTPLPSKDPAPPDPKTGYYNPTVPGRCLSDTNGDIVIPNLAPNHYSAVVTPPDADSTPGRRWIQTTTLEGNHDHDVWVMPNDTGLDTELVVGGEAVPWVQFGFARETPQPDTWACPAGGTAGQTPGCGQVKGQLFGAIPYVPGVGALPGVGGANGTSGMKLDRPIDRGWVAVNSLDASTGDFDRQVATFPTDKNGYFTLNNVPDGDYFITIWDEPQEYALDRFNLTISHGQVVDMGVLPLLGWFSHIYGHVFIDTNGNGRQDPGENGLFHAFVQNLNRTNNAMEGGINTSQTDNNGFYDFKEAYPLGLMSINQFFNTRFKTTGVTWQACNDPQEHSIKAPMVDVSYLPIIGHCGRLDWGVTPYDAAGTGDNGGIVATAIYDEIRAKYNARQAQTYDYQTGIPGFRFEQYTPVKGTGAGGADPLTGYALKADGSYQTVEPLQPANGQDCSKVDPSVLCYVSENNAPPAQCYPRDANGNPIGFDANDPKSLDFYNFGGACIETSAQSTQFGLGTDNANPPVNHPVQTVDGNYTLGNKPVIPAKNLGDVVVRPVVPVDTVLPPGPNGDRPLYKYTTENDVNVFNSVEYIPQGADHSKLVWPPLHGKANQMPTGNYEENPYTTAPGIDPICAGSTFKVSVTNPDFLAQGGSPLQGQTRHTCDEKLLNIQAGQSIAPNFHVHTAVDIPLPAHFWGYIVDDISVETNRKSTNLGEVHGIPGAPVGIYDWTGRRNYSVNSDYNGVWEALMPSAEIFNCPTPAQTCPNVYRFVGNDPGQPGRPNLNYNPNYRTISANFQAWPNMLVPADTAPTRAVASVEGPGMQFSATSPCGVKQQQPQLFAVGPAPYTRATSTTVTIDGANFGSSGRVEFTPEGGSPITLPLVGPWTNNQVKVTIGNNVVVNKSKIPVGPGTLHVIQTVVDPVTHLQGSSTTNGVTFHILGNGYNPKIIEVGYHKLIDPFAKNAQGNFVHPFAIQDALDLAALGWQVSGAAQVALGRSVQDVANDPSEQYLVVVYPHWNPTAGQNQSFVPLGTYFENLIVHSPVKLQGVGPGGAYADANGKTVAIQGSIVDGRFFSTMTSAATDGADTGEGGVDAGPSDPGEPMVQHWVQLLESIQTSPFGTGLKPVAGGVPWSGVQQPLGEGAVVTVLGTTGTYNTSSTNPYNAAIDGFTISGGDQNDFPGNINEVGGTRTGTFPEGGLTDEAAGALSVQGGAVYVNGGTDNYRITNNSIKQNSGAYGAVRFGTLFQSDPALDGGMSHNWNAAVSHNTFVANGGTNLAGAVGLFSDTKNYSIDHNTFCMNASTEYGGAVSHHGYSPGGKISFNKMFLNTAFDEGGAITVASEPAFKVFSGVDVLPIPDPTGFTQGSGAVSIDHNYIGDNLAQDDGGAIRIMGTAGKGADGKGDLSPTTITDNMITNNVSAHEGAALSIFDAPVVNLVNNTIGKNITTATATTSNGQPASGGISSGLNSSGLNTLLQTKFLGQVPAWMNSTSWPTFSNALIQNDVFWDNRAGSWTPNGVAQIGQPGDVTPVNHWDVGSADGAAQLTVSNSVLNSPSNASGQGYLDGGGNKVNNDPAFTAPYDTKITVVQMRTYFRFRPSAIVSVDLPDNALGDYHLNVPSPAQAMGKNPPDGGVTVPDDIDKRLRPAPPTATDAGAHQAGG